MEQIGANHTNGNSIRSLAPLAPLTSRNAGRGRGPGRANSPCKSGTKKKARQSMNNATQQTNSAGHGTLTIYGMGSSLSETEPGLSTDLDNCRISVSITVVYWGRTAHIDASLVGYHGTRITRWHPYPLTGMVTDSWYGSETSRPIPAFKAVPLDSKGLKTASPASLFPYNKAGLLAMINEEFNACYNAIRMIPAQE